MHGVEVEGAIVILDEAHNIVSIVWHYQLSILSMIQSFLAEIIIIIANFSRSNSHYVNNSSTTCKDAQSS